MKFKRNKPNNKTGPIPTKCAENTRILVNTTKIIRKYFNQRSVKHGILCQQDRTCH